MVEASSFARERLACVYPYCNESSIPAELMNVHLAICRRKWRGPVSVCSYNGFHTVPAPEELYHNFTCPDRSIFGEFSAKLDEAKPSNVQEAGEGTSKEAPDRNRITDKNRRAKRWNGGPRLHKKFERLSCDHEQKNYSDDAKLETKTYEPSGPSTCNADQNVLEKRRENRSFYRRVGGSVYRGGGRSICGGGVVRGGRVSSRSKTQSSKFALPSYSTLNSHFDQSTSVTMDGFRPWSWSKSNNKLWTQST